MPAAGEYNVTNYANIKAAIDAALDNGGGTVYIPRGNYSVSGTLLDPVGTSGYRNTKVTIRGDAPTNAGANDGTRLSLSGNVATSTPIFKVHGSNFSTGRAVGFTLKDITLDGNSNSARWISFLMASNARLDRVYIANTRGNGIYAEEWTDSVVHDCSFFDVGDNSSAFPSVDLVTKSSPQTGEDPACQNVTFESVRFSFNRYYAVRLNAGTKFVYFLGCAWVGHSSMSDGEPT